jgi:hypothetical protein
MPPTTTNVSLQPSFNNDDESQIKQQMAIKNGLSMMSKEKFAQTFGLTANRSAGIATPQKFGTINGLMQSDDF